MKYPMEQEISGIFKITREKGKLGKSTETFGKNVLGVSIKGLYTGNSRHFG